MALPECTFTPLSRGRYRCIQTGALVKARQVKTYRYRRQRSGMKRLERVKLPPLLSTTVESWSSYAECPYCGIVTYVGRTGVTPTCEGCGKRFLVSRRSAW